MDKFGKSQPVKRVEDVRFLTGKGRYIDDIAPKNALFAYFFRSPVAHADILTLDLEDARAADGVRLVLSMQDLQDAGMRTNIEASLVDNRDGTKGADPVRPVLAEGRVRFVGEAVACVVADTLAQAMDAAELIEFDYDDIEPNMGAVPGGPLIHAQAPDNVAFDWAKGDQNKTATALENSTHHITLEIDDNRVIVNSMEPRGCYAEWIDGRVHLAFNGQGVWDMKNRLARAFDLPKDRVRVTNPDVGGGFGMKGMPYPEHFVVAQAARATGLPVRWMSERTEAMLSDNAGRDLVSTCELGFDADLKITAYRVTTTCNLGAYNSIFAQAIQSELFHKVLVGTYHVPTYWQAVKGIYTNTVCVDAYRGAGRPEAIYALERLMDHAARRLGVDPLELRRRNFIPVQDFPYRAPTGELYDVGDFHKVLDRGVLESDYAGFDARRAASEKHGKLRGIGLSYYLESILGDASEGATVEFLSDGRVLLFVGTQSGGQGHETVFAQFLADQSGIPADRITVVQGDSDLIAKGGGTGGSRSATTQTNATLKTVASLITGFSAFLADEMSVARAAVTFDDEVFRIAGSNLTPGMIEVAEMAHAKGREDLLRVHETAELEGRSYPNGAHICEVEIDPDTGVVSVEKYSVTDDFGNLINPMLVEGQIHGGVAQGIGQALCEQVAYDEDGQLLSGSFMDYAMPRAEDIPWVKFVSEPVPSTANVLGMKGCGEAGTVGAMAAVANAVQDALWARGIERVDMPFTPQRVWRMLQGAPLVAQ